MSQAVAQQMAADINSVRPANSFTVGTVGAFSSTVFRSSLQAEGASQNLGKCLVFPPDTYAELRLLLLEQVDAEAKAPNLIAFLKKNAPQGKQYLLLPLVDSRHASLLIVCLEGPQPPAPGARSQAAAVGRRTACILHLDSRSARPGDAYKPDIGALWRLVDSWLIPHRGPADGVAEEKEPAVVSVSVPQQKSGGSGAAYMCTSALYFVANLPPGLDVQSVERLSSYRESGRDLFEGTEYCYPGFLTRDWYPENVPKSLHKLVLEGLKQEVQRKADIGELSDAEAAALLGRAQAVAAELQKESKRPFFMPEKRRQKQQAVKNEILRKLRAGGSMSKVPGCSVDAAGAGAAAAAARVQQQQAQSPCGQQRQQHALPRTAVGTAAQPDGSSKRQRPGRAKEFIQSYNLDAEGSSDNDAEHDAAETEDDEGSDDAPPSRRDRKWRPVPTPAKPAAAGAAAGVLAAGEDQAAAAELPSDATQRGQKRLKTDDRRGRITVGGKSYYLGRYHTVEGAAQAEDFIALWLFDGKPEGESRLNFTFKHYSSDTQLREAIRDCGDEEAVKALAQQRCGGASGGVQRKQQAPAARPKGAVRLKSEPAAGSAGTQQAAGGAAASPAASGAATAGGKRPADALPSGSSRAKRRGAGEADQAAGSLGPPQDGEQAAGDDVDVRLEAEEEPPLPPLLLLQQQQGVQQGEPMQHDQQPHTGDQAKTQHGVTADQPGPAHSCSIAQRAAWQQQQQQVVQAGSGGPSGSMGTSRGGDPPPADAVGVQRASELLAAAETADAKQQMRALRQALVLLGLQRVLLDRYLDLYIEFTERKQDQHWVRIGGMLQEDGNAALEVQSWIQRQVGDTGPSGAM